VTRDIQKIVSIVN